MTGFLAFPCSSQKLPSAGGLFIFKYVHVFLIFQIIAAKLTHTLACMSSCFHLSGSLSEQIFPLSPPQSLF
jgi:hypothetical protein